MTTPPDLAAAGQYVSSAQIAAELGVHEQTVQRYFREGGLPGRKIGHSWRTTRAAFDAWLTTAPPTSDPAVALETPTIALETKEPTP